MKKLAQGAVPTTVGTPEYQVPTGFKCDVADICISNTTTGALTCLLYLVPTGGTPDSTNQLVPDVSIDGKTLFQWTGIQSLNSGDYIQVVGSAAGLVMNITGSEYRA